MINWFNILINNKMLYNLKYIFLNIFKVYKIKLLVLVIHL